MKKRILSVVVVCAMLIGLLPGVAVAASATYGTVYVKGAAAPVAGEAPSTSIKAQARVAGGGADPFDLATEFEWQGELDASGRFKSGVEYTLVVTIGADESVASFSEKKFPIGETTGCLLGDIKNATGENMTVASYSASEVVVSYTFPAATGEAKASVNGIAVDGLEVPAPGATPDEDADVVLTVGDGKNADASYSIEWFGTLASDGSFAEGRSYRAEVTVELDDPSAAEFNVSHINGSANSLRINGINAEARSVTASKVVLAYTFENTREIANIKSVAINGIDTPAHDAMPDRAASVDGSAVEILEINWTSAGWSQYATDGSYEPFDGGFAYTVSVLLQLSDYDKYAFDASMSATINGESAKVAFDADRKLATVSYTFEETELITDGDIKRVYIDGVVGPYVFREMEVPAVRETDIMAYQITDYEWSDGADFYGYYKPDTTYTLTVVLEVHGEHRFSTENLNTPPDETNHYANGGMKVLSFTDKKIIVSKTYPKTEAMKGDKQATMVKSPTVFEGGSGTYEDPYLIKTASQLNAIRYDFSYDIDHPDGILDKHYKLIADIDLSDWGNWIPIGSSEAYGGPDGGYGNDAVYNTNSFFGTLDGNGHVISGMTIEIDSDLIYMPDQVNYRYYGLFMNIDSGEMRTSHDVGSRTLTPYTSEIHHGIRNLTMVDYTIKVKYKDVNDHFAFYVGAFSGGSHGSGFYNCHARGGEVIIDTTATPDAALIGRLGGIVGDSSWDDFCYCSNASDITVLASGGYETKQIQAGGIAGTSTASWFISCYNTGDITLPNFVDPDGDKDGTYIYAGAAAGIVSLSWAPEFNGVLYHTGEPINNYVWNCYNTGTITGEFVAGIELFCESDYYLDNCYNIGELNGGAYDPAVSEPTEHDVVYVHYLVEPYGTEYIRRTYTDGNAISGDEWVYSSTLGRKVLKNNREDEVDTSAPEFFTTPGKTHFTDVAVGSYYEDAVLWAFNNGVTTGATATTFAPNATCTRAQVVTFLWRAAGSPEPLSAFDKFTDVQIGDYFSKAVRWAVQKGITNGTSETTFSPHETCTMAHVLTFLHRANKTPAASGESSYAAQYPGMWYTDAAAWADTNGLLAATGKTFEPNAPSPRADIVTYLFWNTK